MRSRLHSRLAAVLILGLSAHGAGAEFPLSAGLTGQALQRLPGKNRALPKRTFLRTAFRSTIEASVRQPITTYRLGKAIYRQRGVALLEDNLPVRVSLTFMPGAPPRPGSAEFEARLDKLGLAAPLPGELSYHLDGGMFFRAFEKALATARQSIDVQVFIFDSDDVGLRCADLLRARAEEIPVRVILDDLGSTFAHGRQPPSGLPAGFKQPRDIGDYLRHGGSKVALRETLNPWLVTDHTKLHLFDRKVAFIGGMNLGHESRHEWHDLMVSVRGPIVAALNRDFERTWERNGPRGDLTLFNREEPLKTAEGPGVPIRILRTDAVNARSDILLAMLQAIRGARER
ncbi:MAG: phospholipase D-like domain-containing protein, partial [Roseibacillus sp.]|nr:phospholipase D-like domain-containing protein [Roseibacillus sp.]